MLLCVNKKINILCYLRTAALPDGGSMRLDSKPVYRKVISPWYDSESLCFCVITFMLLAFFFAIAGIFVAGEHPVWSVYMWVPVLLAGLSAWVLFTTSVRLVRRLMDKRADESRL